LPYGNVPRKSRSKRIGIRVLQYPELVKRGTLVKPALQVNDKEKNPEVKCKNPSWLFFIDEAPDAHFAHPVRIIIMDAVTGDIKEIKTDWWPMLDDTPVFDKRESRTKKDDIIFESLPELQPVNQLIPKGRFLNNIGVKSHDPCDGYAVIVCGYNDLPDTFDEDSDSIYSVLKRLGLMDDHIFFVSPHTTHAGVDKATSIANVQWAINQVATQADVTDKVLFFYTSHGNVDILSCVPGSAGGGYISASDLDNWLDGTNCNELSIVIEACHSGSLIGKYANGTYVAAEDDLTGDGETNRCIFTSASSNTSSYPDVDWVGDPNPSDVGSETIYGYIEAYNTASADVNGDNEISFGEAFQYAWDNDITRINGTNTPQMTPTGLDINDVYHYCYSNSGTKDLFVSDGPGDVGNNSYDYNSTDIWVTQDPAETDHQDVVSGMDNLVHVAVHNRGTGTLNNVTLKVYWGDVSTALSWPVDFNQIGSTYNVGTLGPEATTNFTWTWFVDPAIGTGHHFCLIAIADSPDDPMVGCTPARTYIAPCDNNVAQKNITIIPSHGHAQMNFSFILGNNTPKFDKVDLKIEWIGQPWGEVSILLLDDVSEIFRNTKNEGFSIIELPESKVKALQFRKENVGIIRNIPLKPGEKKVLQLQLNTNKTKIGDRSDLRITQLAGKNEIIGINTVQIRQVDPKDCKWTAKICVSIFADLALKFKSEEAKQISKLFAEQLIKGKCDNREQVLKLMEEALGLEKLLLKRNTGKMNTKIIEQYKRGLGQIEKALISKNIEQATQGQSLITDALDSTIKTK
jgi:hypothetical protein